MGPVLPSFLPFKEKLGRGEMEMSVLRVFSLCFSPTAPKLRWAMYQEGREVAVFFEIISCECVSEFRGKRDESVRYALALALTLTLFQYPERTKVATRILGDVAIFQHSLY